MKYMFIIVGLSFSAFAMEKSTPPKPIVRVPASLLKIIFEARELDDITRLINRTIEYAPELQRFMQSPENVDALIAHIRKKTSATEPFIAVKLRAIDWLKMKYNNSSISQAQLIAILNDAFNNLDIKGIVAIITAIPSLAKLTFDDVEKTPILIRALHFADGFPIVKALIDNGADVNKADQTGMTPLIYAAKYGRTEALQEILGAGADVNKKTSLKSPLFYAVKAGYVQGVKLLLNAGARIDDEILNLAQNSDKEVINQEIYKILQDKKVNPNLKFGSLQIKL